MTLGLLSCEVIMDAAPSKLKKYRYYSYLHQLKLQKTKQMISKVKNLIMLN
jgi:hypothetical protein